MAYRLVGGCGAAGLGRGKLAVTGGLPESIRVFLTKKRWIDRPAPPALGPISADDQNDVGMQVPMIVADAPRPSEADGYYRPRPVIRKLTNHDRFETQRGHLLARSPADQAPTNAYAFGAPPRLQSDAAPALRRRNPTPSFLRQTLSASKPPQGHGFSAYPLVAES